MMTDTFFGEGGGQEIFFYLGGK